MGRKTKTSFIDLPILLPHYYSAFLECPGMYKELIQTPLHHTTQGFLLVLSFTWSSFLYLFSPLNTTLIFQDLPLNFVVLNILSTFLPVPP